MNLTVEVVSSRNEFEESFELLKHLYPKLTKKEFDESLNEMTGNYTQIWVKEEGKLIGLAGLWINSKLFSGKYIEMDNVVVHPDHRSKGIGRLLCSETERIGKQQNCKLVVLDAYVENFEAHKFYYREGYIARGYHFLKKLNC